MTTPDDGAPVGLPTVEQNFSQAWRLFVDRLWLLLTVGGIGASACMLSTFLPFLAALALSSFLPALPLWILTGLIAVSAGLWGVSWMQIAMIEAVLDPLRKPDWKECYRVSRPKVAAFSWVSIIFFVLVAGGAFFIVPGVFLGVACVFAPVVVVAEGTSGWASMTRSMELVSGRWWGVALRLFLAGLASALPAQVPWLGIILGSLSAPFALVFAVVLYDSLRHLPPPAEPPGALQTKVPVAFAVLGLCVMCGLAAVTAAKVRDAMPGLRAQYDQLMTHPPDPQKLQELLAKLQNGDAAGGISETWQLIAPSTVTAAATPAPAPAPAPAPIP